MTEMIERVARVIWERVNLGGTTWEDYAPTAKAAIEAMREPTKEMEEAGDDLDDWGVPSDPGSGNASALAHWHAMIGAALVEQEAEKAK